MKQDGTKVEGVYGICPKCHTTRAVYRLANGTLLLAAHRVRTRPAGSVHDVTKACSVSRANTTVAIAGWVANFGHNLANRQASLDAAEALVVELRAARDKAAAARLDAATKAADLGIAISVKGNE